MREKRDGRRLRGRRRVKGSRRRAEEKGEIKRESKRGGKCLIGDGEGRRERRRGRGKEGV